MINLHFTDGRSFWFDRNQIVDIRDEDSETAVLIEIDGKTYTTYVKENEAQIREVL